VVGDDVVSGSNVAAWKSHEANVTQKLQTDNPNEKIGGQVTLDVYGPDNKMLTIIPDNIYKSGDSYQIVDAKFSQSGKLAAGSLNGSLTPNQKDVYGWIKNGEVTNVVARGKNAEEFGLRRGVSINLTNQVQIAVNVIPSAQNFAIYGSSNILIRNY
ncbi:MAG: hypothetical protein ACRDE5_18450, partial [Ginsengibacter sp.]